MVRSKTVLKGGYVGVYAPRHPRAPAHGYVLEHLLVAERALGKPLPPGVVVHHRKYDDPESLVRRSQTAYAHRRCRSEYDRRRNAS